MVDPVIVYETTPTPALRFVVNFGVFAGREVTRHEIHRLAGGLISILPGLSIVSELHWEVGKHSEAEIHQVRIEVGRELLPQGENIEALRERLRAAIEAWAEGCIHEFSGAELRDAEIQARDAVIENTGDGPENG